MLKRALIIASILLAGVFAPVFAEDGGDDFDWGTVVTEAGTINNTNLVNLGTVVDYNAGYMNTTDGDNFGFSGATTSAPATFQVYVDPESQTAVLIPNDTTAYMMGVNYESSGVQGAIGVITTGGQFGSGLSYNSEIAVTGTVSPTNIYTGSGQSGTTNLSYIPGSAIGQNLSNVSGTGTTTTEGSAGINNLLAGLLLGSCSGSTGCYANGYNANNTTTTSIYGANTEWLLAHGGNIGTNCDGAGLCAGGGDSRLVNINLFTQSTNASSNGASIMSNLAYLLSLHNSHTMIVIPINQLPTSLAGLINGGGGNNGTTPVNPPPVCAGPTVVNGAITASARLINPPYPIVVGQDPSKRGVDLEYTLRVEPTIRYYETLEQVGMDILCLAPSLEYPEAVRGSCGYGKVEVYSPQLECVRHQEIYPEGVNSAAASASLEEDSRDWILNDLAKLYPGAYLHHPDWGFSGGSGGFEGNTYVWRFTVNGVQTADPGKYVMSVSGMTTGTPVSDPRGFNIGAGSFDVWLMESTIAW